MTEFPKLKRALLAWANVGVEQLSLDINAEDHVIDLGHWRRDLDGIFRDVDRTAEVWDREAVDRLFELPSWTAVLDVLHGDSRLKNQVDVLVGTVQGAHHIEATSVGRRVLPRPDELEHLTETFESRYQELERFLAAGEIEYTVIWPLPGLTSDVLPVRLDPKLEFDAMLDRELGIALDTEIVRPMFPRQRLLDPRQAHSTCVRYRYNLPKLVGDTDVNENMCVGEEIEDNLRQIESALKESLAIILPDAIGIAGRFTIESQPGSPLSGGVAFQQSTLPQGPRLRRAHMGEGEAAELRETWRLLRQPGLLERNKGLALALRRLSYQAQREQPEDELLDTMIAAEALYLTGMGDASERGELRYRLALRAALWSEPGQTGFTKREVLAVMRSAYDARSAIAHGGTPKPEIIKVRGQKVALQELARAAKSLITAGCRAALARAASGEGWPPDWDALALGEL